VSNFRRRFTESAAAVIAAILFVLPAHADVVTKADLQIQGSSLAVVDTVVTTQLGTTAFVHTSFGGLQDDQAPVIEGLSAAGDLTGPGITTPIQIITAPGHAFQISGLSQEGVYYLQNVRLMNGTQLLQLAAPSAAAIQVANTLKTTVTVRQLTPDEMRARGINIDPSNYDVFEYTFSFLVNGQTVTVPYPVIINRTTHQPEPGAHEDPYGLPSDTQGAPPRWVPPGNGQIIILPDLLDFGDSPDPPSGPLPGKSHPQIHCAIVIPNSLAVLHQFFAVGLVVANGAPAGSNVKLDSITASIDVPNQLRIAKVNPPTTFGQPVTIKDPNNPNVTFLIAQATGQADWTLEGLKAGTYTVNLDVKGTFQSPGQPDLPLETKPQATVVIHDARFNITFSHPDTIRKDLQYSTYTYITNISDAAQTITLSDQGLPTCSSGGYLANVCRIDTSPSSFTLTLQPGETKSVQYKLQSSLTGHIFATAASIDGDNSAIASAAFQLVMGVSPTGVPLSPATLILPHYATTPYISQNLLDAELGYLGIAYSLATAPLNNQTAKFPRLITTDVFTRAVDLARAGERIFIGEDPRASLSNFTLDSLGNGNALAEWDQFLRQEVTDPAGDTARALENAMGAELSTAFSQTGGTFSDMADRFAGSTTDRGPYVFALVHGPKSSTAASAFDVQVTSVATGQVLGVDATQTSGWKRQIPWGGLFPLSGSVEAGTLAVIGRSNEALDLTITPSVSGAATIDLIFPAPDGVTLMRASAPFTATAGQVVHIHIANGVATSNDVAPVPHAVPVAPVGIVAARQDTFLDPDGHTVSVLFNRRLPATTADLSPDFDTDVVLDSSKFGVSYTGKRTVAGAALQPDRRIIHVNYDTALSSDVQYQIHTSHLVDPASNATVVPVVDPRNSALLLGTVLHGDNTIIPGAQLFLTTKTGRQYQLSDANGKFLFEYIPRDTDAGQNGDYNIYAVAEGRSASLDGTVRLLHTLSQISVVFLGRGSAQGTVRYEDGTRVPNATVVVGSTLFRQFRSTTTKSDGTFSVTDLPVGPLTFSAQDAAGNVAYAANELHAGGEVAVQDISIYRQPFPGVGTVYGRVIRNDTNAPVANVHVGVYSQGYGFSEIFTDATGTFSFPKVPAGFVTVLAANFAISPTEVAVDFDLKANESRNMGDLKLVIPTANTVMVSVDGDVTAEDPLNPGLFHAVPNAQVQIKGMPVVVANAAGHYRYDSAPQTVSRTSISAYDPATRRGISKSLPDLVPYSQTTPTNNVPVAITNTSGSGKGTIRVHLLSASGQPVTGYHVFWTDTAQMWSAEETSLGVYEFQNLAVGTTLPIVAAPLSLSDPTYGYQMTTGTATVSFADQIAAITLRLKGQGTITANIQQQTQAGVFIKLAGKLSVSFRVWDNAELDTVVHTVFANTDGTTDAIFQKVPVLPSPARVETVESAGYASADATIGYDGAVVPKTLILTTLAEVRGHVFAPDGYTPVAGAAVHMFDNSQDLGIAITGFDGSFDYKNIVPSSSFSVTADYTINGIYRTAITTGSTPVNGGIVDNVRLVLQQQGSVEGTVVDSNNNPVPFAKIWLRELSYPARELGTAADPRFTDGTGHFRFNNIFAVSVRVTAEDPTNQESRGDWGGAVTKENDVENAPITLSSTGLGSVRITVLDPNNALAPVPNAEVSLYRGALFDFGTTDASGSIQFDQLPVDGRASYSASAFSKTQFKSGATTSNFAVNKNQTTAVPITLTFSGEVMGTLVDPQNNNAAVPGSNVTLFGTFIHDFYQTRDTTAADGSFDFKGVREGNFTLEARDPNSIRMARGAGLVSAVFPTATIPLTLEPTSTLTVKAFLPNDAGGNSGVLAPLVNIDVTQTSLGGQYLRSSQTNGAQFPGLVRAVTGTVGVYVVVHELGGLARVISTSTSFDANTAAKELDLVFSATGTVNVTVQAGSPAAPMANVQVSASSGGSGRSAYTDANGFVSLSGLPLGNVSIQATSQGTSPLSGSTSVSLNSQTTPATASILLGSYDSVTGKVFAEGTGSLPSAGTRVLVTWGGIHLETRTDSTGSYTFQGIATPPNGLSVHFIYLGPDDNTIGAQQDVTLLSGQGLVTAPSVTLDSTPPRLIGIFPADGASKVAPDTQLKFTFSRAMRSELLTSGGNGYFHLFDSAAGTELTLTLASAIVQPDNTEVITFNTPPTPAGQKFPLKSNSLYRILVSGTLLDLANHVLGADLGASFTTSDYSAPQVTKVDPSPKQPLTKNGVRIGVTFSKPLDPAPWQSGGSGSMTLIQISAIGGQTIGSPIAGNVQLDPISGATLYFAPNVTLTPSAFYRLSLSGVVDTDGRAMVDANGQTLSVYTQDFFTYDNIAPTVTIGNPLINGVAIGSSDPLYLNVLYTIPVTLLNPDGSAVTDLDRVDFWSVDAAGNISTVLRSSPTTVAIAASPGTTTFTLRADAWDLSLNKGTATRSWTVATQPALTINSTAIAPATVYPGGSLTDTVQIGGGGLDANITVTATLDGSSNTLASAATSISRKLFTDPWPSAALSLTIPRTVAGGAKVNLTTSVSDIRGFSATPKVDSINMATDTVAPSSQPVTIQVIRNVPATPALTFNDGDQYRVHGFASDAETGVASMTFTVGTAPYTVNASDATFHANTGVWEFISPVITVQSHNNDNAIAINARAIDYAGNSSSASASVTYLGIHNPNAPTVAWIAPLRDAAWPAGAQNFTAKLRVFATSPLPLAATFDVPGGGTLTATRTGNELDATLSGFTIPDAGTPFQIVAHINDGDGGNRIDLPINIDIVTTGQTIPTGGTIAVDATHPLVSDSVVVDGGRLILYVATTLKNLIVINGGVVDTVPSTTTADQKIDLTITDHLYVDGDSSIDVSHRGYMGGLEGNANDSGTNTSPNGVTRGRVTTGGATSGASGSYAGIGGDDAGATNATYGSITTPVDAGSGGAADSSSRRGGQGGGSAYIHVATSGLGKVVLAGSLLGDGESGVNIGGAGSGGSIHVTANEIVLGAAAKVSANGGDDDGSTTATRAGGGGRVSLEASQLLDIDTSNGTHVFALGGHNNAGETAGTLDGGAGTIFLRNAGEVNGELFISALDSRFPSTTVHLTRATPLAGTLIFDNVTLGARALARADASITIAGVTDDKTKATIDSKAVLLLQSDQPALTVSTNPAAGGNLIQGTSLGLTYTATSLAGVGGVTYSLAPAVAAHTDSFPYGTAPGQQTPSIVVPGSATPGTATLTMRVTDRAGRTFDAPSSTFTIVANQPPVITNFTLTAPNPLYIGNSISAAVAATDEVAVKTLSLTTQIGSGTESTQTFTANSPSASTTFTVPIAKDATLDGQTVTLTAKADDGTAAPVPSVKTLNIAHDGNPPAVTISAPIAGRNYTIDTDTNIHVVATVTDAETGVKSVSVVIEGGSITPTVMAATGNPNEYAADLPLPSVSGSVAVNRTITVTAKDTVGNIRKSTLTVQITPHYDPTAPIVTFTCGSDGAFVSAGSQISLGVTAVPGSSGTAVSSVSFSDGTTTLPATLGSGVYSATYTVPPSATAGSVITIVASAKTNGQGTGTQQVQMTVVVFDKTITSDTTIPSSDTTTYDNKDVVVTAGKLTIVGPHTFKKLVVLGGSVVPKSNDILHPDTITVDTLYVACGASVDATPYSGAVLGFAQNTTYPGAGAAVFDSGGGHIGRGARFNGRSFQVGVPGGTFGSIYHPLEAGGGGMVREPSSAGGTGGGVVRLVANTILVDGSILANGQDSANNGGAGAGGSIYVTTSNISGGGVIQANGAGANATWDSGAGGGGAIAIEYTQAGGTILNNVTAIGGLTSFQGAAGSTCVFGPQSTYGDLVVNNGTRSSSLPANVITELPSFGTAKVLSAPSAGTAVVDAMWEGTYLAGNRLQVTASDGTPRGDWRIASIANDASVRTVNGFAAVPTQSVAYNGYLMYSDTGHPAGKQLVAVRNNAGTWQYDDGSAFTNFTPQTGDVLFASFSTSATAITTAQMFTCPNAVCAPLSGIPTAAVVRGDVAMNGASGTWTVLNGTSVASGAMVSANHTFFIHPDSDTHGFVISSGPATVTLESGADVHAGDTVRGLYRFDHVTIKNARVYTPDLVIPTNTPSVDVNSTWITGNTAAPVIDPSKISVAAGANGPVVIGTTSAALDVGTDAAGPVELSVRNSARSLPTIAFPTNTDVTFGTKGGFSAQKIPNGVIWGGVAATAASSSTYAYVEGRPSQTTQHMDMLLTATATGDAEYDWGIFDNSTCQVWVNNSSVTGTFSYTTNTLFRIERTPSNVYFYLDGQLKYTATIDARPRYAAVVFKEDGAEWNSINYGFDTPARFSGVAAANGSFTVPIYGTAGDALTISARDRHTYPLTSAAATIASIPAAAVISAPALSPNPVIGGHSVTGTVTLGSPAPAGGVTVPLSSSSTSATVPASVTIPANATSANFTITTAVVTAPVTATITATYGAVAYSTALPIVVDNIPPSITLTQPSANAHFLEGSGQITVQATVTDADSGVQSVTATLDGTTYTMTAPNGSNVYSKTITAPFIDGTVSITKQLTVTATDKAGNPAPANVSVVIDPVTDTRPPATSFGCSAPAAQYPTSYNATLSATVIPPSSTNVTQKVEFHLADGTVIPASAGASNTWTAPWTTGSSAATTTITVAATAAGGGSSSASQQVTLIAADRTITTNITIPATDTSLNGKVVAIAAGATVTINGQHNFAKLLVIEGAKVVQSATTTMSLGATGSLTDVYIACNSSIDLTGLGYAAGATLPGETAAGFPSGGSHFGHGGWYSSCACGTIYGNVYHPNEAGGGGENNYGGQPGGGNVHLMAGSVVIDGSIKVTGTSGGRGGAGGSVWINTASISGVGSIDASGGSTAASNGAGAGGGGGIAIEYTDGASVLPALTAAGGIAPSSVVAAGAGTILTKGPGSQYGALIVDNGGAASGNTDLPSLGSGVAQSGSGPGILVTARSTNIQSYHVGRWVEIDDAFGTFKGRWRILSIDPTNQKKVTLQANGSETIDVQQGDRWSGVYLFDSVSIRAQATLTSGDPIIAPATTLIGGTTGQFTTALYPIGGSVEISGNVIAPQIIGESVTIDAGAVLSQLIPGSGPATPGVTMNLSGALTIAAGGAIDLTGRGYPPAQSYPGETAAGFPSGGSHFGRGGWYSSCVCGTVYGSVYHPAENGGGGENNYGGQAGGGSAHITAGSVVMNGSILATGASGGRGGAGGSVWITTGPISGSGTIDASGGSSTPSGAGAGGGGGIAVEYTSGTLPALHAAGGLAPSSIVVAGAGTIVTKGSNSTYGDLTVDNGGAATGVTELPSLGAGIAQSGSSGPTLVTGRSKDIPTYLIGQWVEVTNSVGAVQGTWRILDIPSPRTVTLAPNGTETIPIQPGYGWRGVYRFDSVTVKGATLQSGDRIDGTPALTNGGKNIYNAARPAWDPTKVAQILITPTTNGNANLVAPATTVTDTDAPINLVITNTRTGVAVNATANADGSFTVAVTGVAPDSFTIVATDSHTYPLSSLPIPVNTWLAPITVASVSVAPSLVNGTATATGTVTLSAAPAASTVVSLASSAASIASAPASVTVAAGQTTATFTITTTNPAVDTTATITATLTGSQATSTLTVKSVAVAVQFAPGSVTGGSSSAMTVTLGAPAAAVMTLNVSSSNNTVASVATTISFAAGSTTSLLNVTTTSVSTPTNVVITVTYGGVTGSATLTVTPSTATSFPMSTWTSDPNFTAERVAVEGRTLAVYGSTSDQVVLLDTTSTPPALIRTVSLGGAKPSELVLRNGWAYVASSNGGFGTFSTTTPSPTINGFVLTSFTTSQAVALLNNVAFVGNVNGSVLVYDIIDPANPRLVTTQTVSGSGNMLGLFPLADGHYLYIISDNAWDTAVFDTHDGSNYGISGGAWTVKQTEPIPNFAAKRGVVVGNTLYLTGPTGVIPVDITNPASPSDPTLDGVLIPVSAGAIDASGTDVYVAANLSLTPMAAASNRLKPVAGSAITLPATARDVRVLGPNAYIASGSSLTIAPINGAPVITPSLVTIGALSGGNVTITGTAGAAIGNGTITVTVDGGTTSASATAAGNGSFSVTLAAAVGDSFTLHAADSSGKVSSAYAIGSAAVGTPAVSADLISAAGRARAFAREGNTLAVYAPNMSNAPVFYYDISNPTSPHLVSQSTLQNEPNVKQVAIVHGVKYELRTNHLYVHGVSSFGGSGSSFATDGTWAFVGKTTGSIDVLNVFGTQFEWYTSFPTIAANVNITDVVLLGSRYLAAISPSRPSGVGHDLVIFDRSNVFDAIKVKDLDVGGAGFNAQKARLVGNTLYLFGADGGVAFVDVTDPANPSVNQILTAPETMTAGDANGSVLTAAAGFGGIKIDNFADSTHPRLGQQAAGNIGYDALFGANALYVGGDRQFLTIPYAAAPVLSPTLVSLTTSGSTTTVTGAAGAVAGGSGTITLELRNDTNISTTTVNSDGSFSATISATLGKEVTIKATDGAGRVAGPTFVGTVFGPPMVVDASKITYNFNGSLSLSGIAGAVSGGAQPITAILVKWADPTSRILSGIAVGAGGVFTSPMPDPSYSNDTAIIFSDSSGQSSAFTEIGTPLTIGTVGGRLFLRNQSGTPTLALNSGYVNGTFPVTLTIIDQRTGETQSTIIGNGNLLIPFTAAHAQVGDVITLSAVDAKGSHATATAGTVPPPVVIDVSKITVRSGVAQGSVGAITGGPGLQISIQIGSNIFQAVVAANGSFSTPVSGSEGAAVTFTASDANTSSTTVTLPPYTNITFTMSVTPTTVSGSTTASGTVTLSSASTTSTTISLVSSAPPAASVPANVTVSAFSTTANFTVTTTNPAADTNVTITASRSGVTATSTLTVKSVAVSLQPASQTLAGGASSNATVTISPAAVAQTTINLSASANVSNLQSTVVINAGQTSAQIFFTVANPTSATTATITATYGAAQAATTLSVTPTAGLSIDISKIHFGQSGTSYTLYGTAGAISGGVAPRSVSIIDTQYNFNSQYGLAVDSTGAFAEVVLRASSGEPISIQANDSANAMAGPIPFGAVPFDFSATPGNFLIHNNDGSITVTDSPGGSVTGASPISIQFTDTRSGATTAPISINSGGSFTVSIPNTVAGDVLTVTVVDAIGRRVDNLTVGKVLAAPTVTSVAITSAMADAAFLTRILSIDGTTKTLVVASRPDDAGTGASDKLVLFDLTNPSVPAYRTTIATGKGAVNGIWTAKGWLYAVTDTALLTIDLRTSPPAVHVSADAPVAQSASVAVQGTWAVVAGINGTNTTNGEYDVFDVTDPANPQLFSAQQNGGGYRVTSLLPWRSWIMQQGTDGPNYMISTEDPTWLGLYWFPVSGVKAWAAVDDHVYGVSHGSFVSADFDEWANAQNVIYGSTAGDSTAIDIAGSTAVVAEGTVGVSLIDVSDPLAPAFLQVYGINAKANDLKIANNVVYVAAEGDLKIIANLPLAPAVEKRQIATTGDGVTAASVTGGNEAVTGQAPVTASITTSTGGSASGITVAAAGTFGPTALVAPPGADVTIGATDGASRHTTRTVGMVPFTIAEDTFDLTQDVADDPNATMRRLVVDGTHLYAAAGYPWDTWSESDEIFGFDTTAPLAAQAYPDVFHAGDAVQNFVVVNGWAYVAGATSFSTVNLSTGKSYNFNDHTPQGANAVAVIGHYAFVGAPGPNDGYVAGLQIFDITNPASAVWVREVDGILDPSEYWGVYGLQPLGANRLIVFQPYSGIKILDVSNVQNITVAGSVALRGAADGTIDGNTLYVTGDYDGIHIVDITNPASPASIGWVDSLGPSLGVAVIRPGLIAIATGTAGLTFADVSDRTNPIIKGTQQVGGSPIDIRVVGKTIYTAGELILDSLKLP